jgi:hypothetical protein
MTRVIGPCEWCGNPAYSTIATGSTRGAACPSCRAGLRETSPDARETRRQQTTFDYDALDGAPTNTPNNAMYGSEAA